MSAACVSMVLVILVTSFLFIRAQRRDYGLAILPLISVPGGHVLATLIVPWLIDSAQTLPDKTVFLYVAIDVTALIFGCIALGITSQNIESKKNRRLFLSLSVIYLIIIVLVVINNVLSNNL